MRTLTGPVGGAEDGDPGTLSSRPHPAVRSARPLTISINPATVRAGR